MLQIDVATHEFEPGAEVDLELRWELEEPPEAIELRIVWNTAGKGDTDFRVAAVQRFDHPSAIEACRETVTLPHSPYSFSGTLVSLMWALELVALPQEDSTRTEIVIAPGGREVTLQALPTDFTRGIRLVK